MHAIIWKEVRENLKWALLWMLAMAAAMAFALWSMAYRRDLNYPISLLHEGFPLITIPGAAISGAFFGFMQIMSERRRDQWAFLIHRPITPSRIFLGKVIAGLSLYTLAMLLPFLGAAAWRAAPGNSPTPFVWQELLPGIADILAGITFYFAAMLVAVRDARWYVSRPLPIVAPILCMATVVSVPEFWHALLFVALFLAVLAPAAWGSFVASGQYRSQPGPAKPALGLLLLTGIIMIGFLCVVMIMAPFASRTYPDQYTRYVVDKDARVLRLDFSPLKSNTVTNATDLAGNAVSQYVDLDLYRLQQDPLLQLHPIGYNRYGGMLEGTRQPPYRSTRRLFVDLALTRHTLWWFVPSERLILGYDVETYRRIGTATPAGFAPADASPADLFPATPAISWESSLQESLLAFSSIAYYFNPQTRQTQPLVVATEDAPIVKADLLFNPAHTDRMAFAVVITTDRIFIFPDPSQPPISFPPHYPFQEYPNISMGQIPDGGYMIHYQTRHGDSATSHMVHIADDGTELNRYDLPTLRSHTPSPTSRWYLLTALVIPSVSLVAIPAALTVWPLFAEGYSSVPKVMFELARGASRAIHDPFVTPWLAILLVGSLVWAFIAYIITRRYGLTPRQSRGWALAGFLLGPAGLLMLLCLRDWPAMVTCRSCSRPRPADRDDCPRCRAPFPPPAPIGTEIFEDPEPLTKAPIGG